MGVRLIRSGRRGKRGPSDVFIDPGLRELAEEKAVSLGIEFSTFLEWCVQTGLILGDLNRFVHEKFQRS